MRGKLTILYICTAFLLLSINQVSAQTYEVTEMQDGDFQFEIYGQTINEGSSLQRNTILLNDPSCPVELESNTVEIKYSDRDFKYEVTTDIIAKEPVTGVKAVIMLYDAFGQHIKNLGSTEIKDFNKGSTQIEGTWRAYDNEITEFLTSVVYIRRVRYTDGSQWVYNKDKFLQKLGSLDLEEIAKFQED